MNLLGLFGLGVIFGVLIIITLGMQGVTISLPIVSLVWLVPFTAAILLLVAFALSRRT